MYVDRWCPLPYLSFSKPTKNENLLVTSYLIINGNKVGIIFSMYLLIVSVILFQNYTMIIYEKYIHNYRACKIKILFFLWGHTGIFFCKAMFIFFILKHKVLRKCWRICLAWELDSIPSTTKKRDENIWHKSYLTCSYFKM
jgi:hypothetical protein